MYLLKIVLMGLLTGLLILRKISQNYTVDLLITRIKLVENGERYFCEISKLI